MEFGNAGSTESHQSNSKASGFLLFFELYLPSHYSVIRLLTQFNQQKFTLTYYTHILQCQRIERNLNIKSPGPHKVYILAEGKVKGREKGNTYANQ